MFYHQIYTLQILGEIDEKCSYNLQHQSLVTLSHLLMAILSFRVFNPLCFNSLILSKSFPSSKKGATPEVEWTHERKTITINHDCQGMDHRKNPQKTSPIRESPNIHFGKDAISAPHRRLKSLKCRGVSLVVVKPPKGANSKENPITHQLYWNGIQATWGSTIFPPVSICLRGGISYCFFCHVNYLFCPKILSTGSTTWISKSRITTRNTRSAKNWNHFTATGTTIKRKWRALAISSTGK